MSIQAIHASSSSMAPMAFDRSMGREHDEATRYNGLGRAIQVALMVYLLPVIVIVTAIGGAAIVYDRASKVVVSLHHRISKQPVRSTGGLA